MTQIERLREIIKKAEKREIKDFRISVDDCKKMLDEIETLMYTKDIVIDDLSKKLNKQRNVDAGKF